MREERAEYVVAYHGQPVAATKPGPVDAVAQLRSEVIDKMEAAGLIEGLLAAPVRDLCG